VVETVGDGNDWVIIGDEKRHVHGYLEDFLFPPERARSPVKALSGGERNRLLLAKLFTKPANVLVLDEPTNDLDLETLELLEAQLVAFPGTVLLVSHDREFLNRVVTSAVAFEGEGDVREYVGGYDDWLRQRPAPEAAATPATPRAEPPPAAPSARRKLTFNEQRELDGLPAQIAAAEARQAELETTVAAPDFYRLGAQAMHQSMADLEQARRDVDALLHRWSELEDRRA
jgi:ATP-binding cassette subfamily F protein uup